MPSLERPAAPGPIEKEWNIDHEPDLRQIFGDIREDLTQLYRRAEYLISAGASRDE